VHLGLQRRAPRLLLRHFWQSARRVTVLMLVDLSCFWLMRWGLRFVRDHATVGEVLLRELGRLVPPGALSGWQYGAALLLGLVVMGNYGTGDRRRDPRRLLFAAALATALPLWKSIWTLGPEIVAVQFAVITLLVWAGLGVGRLAVQRVVSRVMGVGHSPYRTLFVGPASACRGGMTSPAFANDAEHEILGFADSDDATAPDAIGPAASVAQLLRRHYVEVVVLCGSVPDPVFNNVVEAAFTAGCELVAFPRYSSAVVLEPKLSWRAGQPVIQLSEPHLRGSQLVAKRIVDVVGSVAGLLLASPVMAAIAAAVKLDSPGPVLFRQVRIGAGGRRFRVFKFRTMRHRASDEAHRAYVRRLLQEDKLAYGNGDSEDPVYKLVGDERVTRVGRWLRRTSLDELPQLVNVLLGDMSLVGPRPPLAYEVEAYEHWQYERLGVKPGITGLWQVSGRSRLTYRRMCELDAEYVRTWSVLLDLQIMLRTLPVVLTNSGKAS